MNSYRGLSAVMKVRVARNEGQEEVEVPEGSTVEAVLRSLGLLSEAHIVLRGRVPIPVDEPLRDGESIRLIKVASGG